MSDEQAALGLVLAAFYALALIAMAIHAPFRQKVIAKLVAWTHEIRRLSIENPLRAITGRQRPDHRRIAQLERSELR